MSPREWRRKLRVFLAFVAQYEDLLEKGYLEDDRTGEWWQQVRELLQEIENLKQELYESACEDT